jgi:hypothetical protein
MFAKRAGGDGQDLLVGLGFLLCWVPHAYKSTVVI